VRLPPIPLVSKVTLRLRRFPWNGRCFDRSHGGFDIEAVEIGHLDFGDFLDLLEGDLPTFALCAPETLWRHRLRA